MESFMPKDFDSNSHSIHNIEGVDAANLMYSKIYEKLDIINPNDKEDFSTGSHKVIRI